MTQLRAVQTTQKVYTQLVANNVGNLDSGAAKQILNTSSRYSSFHKQNDNNAAVFLDNGLHSTKEA